jgi:hypothetical protein
VEKYGRARKARDENMARAPCTLGNEGYRHTHTHTHTEYAVLIAYRRQKWLLERVVVLYL